jgi:hypothetical protein
MVKVWTTSHLLLASALMLSPVAAPAGDLAAPGGPVVLTVTGKITRTNRGPFDDFEDAFLKYHERRFEKAAAFDRAMLEGLGMAEVVVRYDAWPKSYRFQGPWLKDVLAAVGAAPEGVTILALDGFAQEISKQDLDAYDWIVAIKRDGRFLDIGRHGPLWVVYGRRDGQAMTEDDEQRWPWAAFLIDVQ